MPSIFRPVTAFARKALKKKKNAEESLAEDLDAAERVHPPPEFSIDGDYTDYTERDCLHHLLDQIDGDGLWKCCRGHEQELIHWKGSHPFKRLQCNRCEHILCQQCESTAVLTCLELGPIVANEYHEVSGLISYGHICPNCGLTHRARSVQTDFDAAVNETVVNMTFDDMLCVCGRLADNKWLRFFIGPIYEYRRNPHEAFARLSRQRAEAAVRRQQDILDQCAERESPPESSSPAGNPYSHPSVPHAQESTGSISTSRLAQLHMPSTSESLGSMPSVRASRPPSPYDSEEACHRGHGASTYT